MIISASYKTDIPAFYGEWFRRRLAAGYCRTVNPYGRQISIVPLERKSVDGFVFWTRNPAPFLTALEEVRERGFPFVLQMTITGYPRALDAATLAPEQAAEHLRTVALRYGPRVAVWRYDPVVFTSLTPPAWHREHFARLAGSLAGAVDEVVVSLAQIYRKTARNMGAAARAFRFDWRDPPAEEKRALLAELAAIARTHGMTPTLCGQPELLVEGVGEARCIDAGRLGDVAGQEIAAPLKSHRQRCGCYASRDIGEYDTCPHGCVYCYAVQSRTAAKRRFRAHDPRSEFLFAPPPGFSREPREKQPRLL
jgi:hypothetical protein